MITTKTYKFFIIILIFISCNNLQRINLSRSLAPKENSNSSTISYYLVFLTPLTKYPFMLNNSKEFGRWYKYGCDCFIDEIDGYQKNYELTFENSSKKYFLFFNSFELEKNNQLLDHYESRYDLYAHNIIHDFNISANKFVSHSIEIYTTAYVKNFEIILKQNSSNIVANDIEFTCRLLLLLPSSISDEQEFLFDDILQDSISIIGAINDSQSQIKSSKKKSRSLSNNKLNKRTINNREIESYDYSLINEYELSNQPLKVKSSDSNQFSISCNLNILDHMMQNHVYKKTLTKFFNYEFNKENSNQRLKISSFAISNNKVNKYIGRLFFSLKILFIIISK